MKSEYNHIKDLQNLVLDIIKVQRNHSVPGANRHENVVEHSFAVTMFCWKIFEMVKPPLNISKILKYALVHDFTERGREVDVNTYATAEERVNKKLHEAKELAKISKEFSNFKDFTKTLEDYEKMDEEALFVWTVDKMQSILLGEIDKWRPYQKYSVTYTQFCEKGDEFLQKSSPYLKNLLQFINESSRQTYYDRPKKKATLRKSYK